MYRFVVYGSQTMYDIYMWLISVSSLTQERQPRQKKENKCRRSVNKLIPLSTDIHHIAMFKGANSVMTGSICEMFLAHLGFM